MQTTNTDIQTGSQPLRIGSSETLQNTNGHSQLQAATNSTITTKPSSTELNGLQEIILEANRLSIETQPYQIALLKYHREFPIKKMDANLAKRKFYEVLTVIVQVYFGADKNTPDTVFAECYDRMIKDYGSISIEEVREAHAESSKSSLKAFGGIYTVNMFSETMFAWKQKRNKILSAIDKIELNDTVKEAQLTELKKIEFSKYCNDWLTAQLLNRTVKNYMELNLGICSELIQAGTVKGQRKDLWEMAKIEAVAQLKQEREQSYHRGDMDKVKGYNSILQKIDEHNYPPDMKGRTEAIYARLLVFDCIESNG